eukprot:182836-Pleurochrysis_carterae.AAC.2
MLMIRDFSLVRSSYDGALVFGGPLVRLSMSTACVTAWSQKVIGDPLATRADRVSSMIDLIALSATPLS